MKMMRLFLALITIVFLNACTNISQPNYNIQFRSKQIDPSTYDIKYEVGNWEHPNYKKPYESLGNHRYVVQVPKGTTGFVKATFNHRLPKNITDHRVVNTVSGEVLENTLHNGEGQGLNEIAFPATPDCETYHIYIYPHKSTGGYYPKVEYTSQKRGGSMDALKSFSPTSLESIDEFHSFYPMEISTVIGDTNTHNKALNLHPEYRIRPFVENAGVPLHCTKEVVNGLKDTIKKGEFYAFQIGVSSGSQPLENLKFTYHNFPGEVTCFNKEGIDLNGKEFTQDISIEANDFKSLWFGVDIPETAQPGTYTGLATVFAKGHSRDTVFVQLTITNEIAENHGDNIGENLSRMRWLNSTIGTDPDYILPPFAPVKYEGKKLSILGREVIVGESGLPQQINSFFTQELTTISNTADPILNTPMSFDVTIGGQKQEWKSTHFEISQKHQSAVQIFAKNETPELHLNVSGTLEYDGHLSYELTLIPQKDLQLENTGLNIPLTFDASKYILGLGYKGQKTPTLTNWKWDVKNHHEGAWLGGINKGLQFVLRDQNYERPLNTNFYHAQPLNLPPSWYNEGKGGISIAELDNYTIVNCNSGSRNVNKGDTLHYHVRFLITPFKPIDTKAHFSTRFVHKYVPVDSVESWKGTVVNVHHANEINPYINYPFYSLDKQKEYIDKAHGKGIKVKLYNTIRELTYKSHELHALRSLGHEILNDGKGGGHPWLQEHLRENYHSAWHAAEVNDAAILNKGNSRWTNFYVEGINWLAKEQEIDGLYLDDIAFSRTTVKRIANVLSQQRDSVVIDLHSANQYNHRDGYINSAFLYMEHFPYISRLWFGEYFENDGSPDYWLTEMSGLPFGLTGEMLEKGGHPYRGMVYGMTARMYQKYDPRAMWDFIEKHDLANSKMIGYWVDDTPFKLQNPALKATVYEHTNKTIMVIASWSSKQETVQLQSFNWKGKVSAPEIKGLQKYRELKPTSTVKIPANQGLMLVFEKTKG